MEGDHRKVAARFRTVWREGNRYPSRGDAHAVWIVTYHAELGLKFYLQSLEGASQVSDFRLATLKLLSVDSDFPVQLLSLKQRTQLQEKYGASKRWP